MLVKMGESAPKGVVLAPDGSIAAKPHLELTMEQAKAFRVYKATVLRPLGLREALYCNRCFEGNFDHDGTKAIVTDEYIHIECRCRVLTYHGQTV